MLAACDGGAAPEPTGPVPDPCEPVAELLTRSDGLMDLGSAALLPRAGALILEAEATAPDCATVWLAKGRLLRAGAGASPGAGGVEDQARAHLERALQLDPDSEHVALALAGQLYTSGDPAAADARIATLLAEDPDHPQALLLRGEILLATGDIAGAVAVLERCIESAHRREAPQTAFQASGALGTAYERLGRVDDAEALLLEAATELDSLREEHPGQTKINCPHESLAGLYLRSGQREQRAQYAAEAADLRAWVPELQYQAAQALLDIGDADGASIYLRRGDARDPMGHHRQMRDRLRRRAARQGASTDPGQAALASAVTLADRELASLASDRLHGIPLDAWGADHHALDGLLATILGDAERAGEALDRAAALDPAHPAITTGQTHQALERRDLDLAVHGFEDALSGLDDAELARGEGLAWLCAKLDMLGLGWSHQARGEHEQAAAAFARVLAQRPDDLHALVGLGNALNGLGRPAEAQERFQRVLAFTPEHPRALAGLGTALHNQGELALAEEVFHTAQRVAPEGYACPYEGLGLVHLARGEDAAARDQFELAIEIEPGRDHRKYDELARLELAEGDLEEARRLLTLSLANHPSGEGARTLMLELERAEQAPGPGEP